MNANRLSFGLFFCSLGWVLACSSEQSGTNPTPDSPKPPPPSGVDISPPGGLFAGQVVVELGSKSPTAEVHYTLDGSAPSASSPLYREPLMISETTQLRARAFEGGQPFEAGAGAVFVERAFDTSSELPLIVVDGFAQGKPDRKQGDDWVTQDAAIIAIEPAVGEARLSQPATLATRAGHHLRGQSSASFEKAPYKVEFWDETNSDVDLPFLGLPAESDWALLGPYEDRALIRNAFAFDLGRQLGLKAPRYAFAEVYINHDGGALEAADYEGIYMVAETIKNSKRRLDLEELEPDDTEPSKVTGGYIFKFDWAAAQEPLIECGGAPEVQHAFGQCLTGASEAVPPHECNGGSGGGFGGGFGGGAGANDGATCWSDLEVVDPKTPNAAQEAYLTQYVSELNDALHLTPLGAYAEYIDVASFVDTLILNELLRNGDAYTRSVYFHKGREQKLVAGPLWDFNLTLGGGGATFCNHNPEGWAYEFRRGSNDWFQRLIGDPAFLDAVKARWRSLRGNILSQANLESLISTIAMPLRAAAGRDYERWPICDVADASLFSIPQGETWEAQLQVMRDLLSARSAWLDAQWQ